MRVDKVSDKEFNVIVEGKGWFNVMFEDWGGEYPGVDTEWHWEGEEHCVTLPRVLFEIADESENPSVKIWTNPNCDDLPEEFDFNKEDFVCTEI